MSPATKPGYRLQIVVVGAGLGGLSGTIACATAGHNVEVIESAKELTEVGAGLQITPNATKILQSWNLHPSFWSLAAEPAILAVHRYSGEILAKEENFNENIRRKYGAPFLDYHRADLQQALYARALDLGVKFHFGQNVESIDTKTSEGGLAKVRVDKGVVYKADLVVAADGLWSKCRESFLGKKDPPLPTGDLAYRIVLTADQLKGDDELASWVRNPQCHFWIGPGAHAVGYSLRGGEMFNIVLLVPDDLPAGVSRQPGSVEEMRALFKNWDPLLNRFLSYATSADKWKLNHNSEMQSWVSDENNLVFMGDACHPMLPYLAQGANSSIEDGVVLGALLRRIKQKSDVPHALKLYQSLRKARGEAIVRETFKQRRDFHLPDGEEQRKRDQIFLSQLGKELKGPFPSRWTCPQVQPWLYGYDAFKEVEQAVAAQGGSRL